MVYIYHIYPHRKNHCIYILSHGLYNGIPSGKRLHNYGKSQFLMGKSTISTGPFSIAMFVYQRVREHPFFFNMCSDFTWPRYLGEYGNTRISDTPMCGIRTPQWKVVYQNGASMLGHWTAMRANSATAWQIDLLWMVAKSCTTLDGWNHLKPYRHWEPPINWCKISAIHSHSI